VGPCAAQTDLVEIQRPVGAGGGLGWGRGREGHCSLWPSLKKNFQPHPYPPQIGFAVLQARGHLHLLSPHQAPGTVLSTLRACSHVIPAATL